MRLTRSLSAILVQRKQIPTMLYLIQFMVIFLQTDSIS